MSKSAEVAAELRRIADALDKEPDVEIVKPWVTFYCDSKSEFLATSRLMPRPLRKEVASLTDTYSKLELKHDSTGARLNCSVPQSEVCIMVEPARPARYECPSILSAEEEAALGTF
jgi:hypothetical protein